MPYKDKLAHNKYTNQWKKDHPEYVSEYNKKYRSEHREKLLAYNKEYDLSYQERRKDIYLQRKKAFFDMYGNECACCGEDRKEFLTIEHRQGQVGKKKEQGRSVYIKATKEYRPDLYEALCMNCNFSKGKFGYCPHQIEVI